MKKMRLSVIGTLIMLLLSVSCVRETVVDEPEPQAPVTKELRVRLVSGNYTRVTEDQENAVKSLVLSLYKGDTFLESVQATKDGSNWGVSLTTKQIPDGVIAFANLALEKVPQKSLTELATHKITDLGNESSGFVMTNSVYFDSGNKKIYAVPVGMNNLMAGGDPVTINIERVAAKVSVTLDDDVSPFVVTMKDLNGNNRNVKLTLSYWGLTAIERESYLLKSLDDYSTLSTLFTDWSDWNDVTKRQSHWAKSVSYSDTSYPDGTSNPTENDGFPLKYYSFETMNYQFNTPRDSYDAVYTWETTRPHSEYIKKNALPSIVIQAQYAVVGGQTEKDYYRQGEKFFTWAEYVDYIAGLKMFMGTDGNPIGATKLKSILIMEKQPDGPNLHAPQISPRASLDEVANVSEDSKTEMNTRLKALGFSQKYPISPSYCYFIVPIEHLAKGSDGSLLDITGKYGVVRNHYYRITIKEISGIGNGTDDEKSPAIVYADNAGEPSYSVNASVGVVLWQDVTQNVVISK